MGKKKSPSTARKARHVAYKAEGRREKHKVNKLARRLKHYSTQPPKILKGIAKTNKHGLAEAIATKIKKLRNE